MKVALSALDAGRITIGAISVGLAQRALDESISYSMTREQFGTKIFDFQGLQFMMAIWQRILNPQDYLSITPLNYWMKANQIKKFLQWRK